MSTTQVYRHLKLNQKANENRITILENEQRRNNLVIGGVRVGQNMSIKQAVLDMFRDVLGLQIMPTLVAARMLGPPNAQNRPILVTLLGKDDKDTIIKHTSALRSTNIWINQDFTWEIREKRRILLSVRGAIKRKYPEKNVRVSFDKLIVDNEKFWWDPVLGLVHRQGSGVEKIKALLNMDVADDIERMVQRNIERSNADSGQEEQRAEEQEAGGGGDDEEVQEA
ncbi:hypothetical protein GE061_004776 [Apolygus lucorum]|uniref:Uncharacterized protein n=1 Tax=Apolygus lucorum TaxID=248454 RepID=A0A6A4IU80_APOLU|nr:hypothetical protein GE061_004776 [Apolygus lucorum]